VASARVSKRTWFESRMFCDRNEKMMMEKGEAECGCPGGGPRKKKSESHATKERTLN